MSQLCLFDNRRRVQYPPEIKEEKSCGSIGIASEDILVANCEELRISNTYITSSYITSYGVVYDCLITKTLQARSYFLIQIQVKNLSLASQ